MDRTYTVTGLMSGSSLDGVDLVSCIFTRNMPGWGFEIVASETLPYPAELKNRLINACDLDGNEIMDMDRELGIYYSNQINSFHSRFNIKPDLIASHGHTLLHEPRKGITVQAGNGPIMAKATGVTVVNDFRKEDVAQGGEGAPLVPAGDRLLFGQYRACLNLGGFANVSYEGKEPVRIAFDICPVNMALNRVAGLSGLEFDKDGAMAGSGSVDNRLLNDLNKLDYYSLLPPKSLGREWFLSSFLPVMLSYGLSPEDRMSTVSEHIARQIAIVLNKLDSGPLLVSGGGALNLSLMDRLRKIVDIELVIPDLQIIQFKEALIFAFLGLLRVLGEINCYSSVTGGKSDLSAGTINKVNH